MSHKNLTDVCNNIIKTSKDLSKEIGKNIVIKIEKGVYNTTCPDCKEHIDKK